MYFAAAFWTCASQSDHFKMVQKRKGGEGKDKPPQKRGGNNRKGESGKQQKKVRIVRLEPTLGIDAHILVCL